MGSANCCTNNKKLDPNEKAVDIEKLDFRGLDYNRSSTYEKLEKIAMDIAACILQSIYLSFIP